MRTLQLSPNPPLFYLPKPPFRDSRIFPGTSKEAPNCFSSNWKLQASAKGFSNSPSSAPSKEISTNKNKNNNNGDDQIPQVVLERMTVRILASVGVPLATGLALLHYFGVVKEQKLWEVPLWLPFLTTLVTFGASTLGVAYGSLSASWDPKRKGSVLGWGEAQRNWVEMWKEDENDNPL